MADVRIRRLACPAEFERLLEIQRVVWGHADLDLTPVHQFLIHDRMGAILLGLIGRVAYLQTTEAENLRSAAADQWTRSVTIPAQRGTVFDRHGAELAMSVPAVTVSINPAFAPTGHYIPEEAPDVLFEDMRAFFGDELP